MDSRVKDVMTTDVVSVRETAQYKDIVSVLRALHVSALPVLDEADHLVGVSATSHVLETATVMVPQTWRVAGRLSISGERHGAASAMTAMIAADSPQG